MREIKFRAWDKLKKKVVEVAGINFVEGIVMAWKSIGSVRSTYYAEANTMELMQFTGLHDKNGKEIYESDIVKGDFWIGKDIGEIRFGNYAGQTNNDDFYYGIGFYISLRNDSEMFGIDKEDLLEVIGNIYENPNCLLLKSEVNDEK